MNEMQDKLDWAVMVVERAFESGDLAVTCEAAPFQVEGVVNGFDLYFRERHGGWGLSLKHPDGRCGAAFGGDDGWGEIRPGPDLLWDHGLEGAIALVLSRAC